MMPFISIVWPWLRAPDLIVLHLLCKVLRVLPCQSRIYRYDWRWHLHRGREEQAFATNSPAPSLAGCATAAGAGSGCATGACSSFTIAAGSAGAGGGLVLSHRLDFSNRSRLCRNPPAPPHEPFPQGDAFPVLLHASVQNLTAGDQCGHATTATLKTNCHLVHHGPHGISAYDNVKRQKHNDKPEKIDTAHGLDFKCGVLYAVFTAHWLDTRPREPQGVEYLPPELQKSTG